MITITGKYYDGKTSQAVNAECSVYDNGVIQIELTGENKIIVSNNLDQIRISPRLANTPRYIYFPDDAQFETDDNDSLDLVLNNFRKHSWLNIVHLLESRKKYILIATFIIIALFYGSVKYGVPIASKLISQWLPPSAFQLVSEHTLQVLDRSILEPSELDSRRKSLVLEHFKPAINGHPDYEFNILFRKGGAIGPNAFALPDGTIVFTDEMVLVSENNDELLAILIHEMGHVVHRHSMRTMIQDSLLGFALLAITGDVAGSSELLLGLPVLLTELAYSRQFELEADDYALEWLKANSIDPSHFAEIMSRIESKRGATNEASDKKWLNYLSTHPLTDERIKRFESSEP
jgi:Zn-dependent protease with chaperone function